MASHIREERKIDVWHHFPQVLSLYVIGPGVCKLQAAAQCSSSPALALPVSEHDFYLFKWLKKNKRIILWCEDGMKYSVHKVLLGHSRAHLCRCCVWLLLHFKSGVKQLCQMVGNNDSCWPSKLKTFTSWPFILKKILDLIRLKLALPSLKT